MRRLLTAALIATSVLITVATPHAAAADDTAAFESLTPCRLLDTRESRGLSDLVPGGTTLELQAADTCDVSGDATALALTVTSVDAKGLGFITVFPSAIARPEISNLNFSAQSTVANTAVTKVSDQASFKVYVHTDTHLVVDVSGQFIPTDTATSGRFIASSPYRVLDTRTTGQRGMGTLNVPLPDTVPDDAIAVAASITIVDAERPSYATVYEAGTSRPTASNVNVDWLDRTRSSTTLAPVNENGFDVYRHATSDLVIDIWGYMTGATADEGIDGLFIPVDPYRVWDSRESFDPLNPRGWKTHEVSSEPSSAVVANIAAVDTIRPGWTSTFSGGYVNSDVSMMNVSSRDPRSALTFARTSESGLGVMSHAGAQMIIDVFGTFTGSPPPAGPTGDSNPANAVPNNVLFISDSSFAGIRWSGNLGELVGSNFTARLESCRRLIGASCLGREGYAPPTALSTLRYTPGVFNTLVIGTGYNDSRYVFESAFEQIMEASRARGITQVIWLTYRTEVTYTSPGAISNANLFRSHNAILYAKAGSGLFPELHLADWDTYSSARTDWVTYDGVHMQSAGARAVSRYISNIVASLDRRPCPAANGRNNAGGWCTNPDLIGVQP
jgi:hypothetical protein